MARLQWDRSGEIDSLQGEMNRLFSTFFDVPQTAAARSRRWVPAMDLQDAGNEFRVLMDLPGMSEQDIDVEVDDQVLTVSGERTTIDARQGGEGWARTERASGSFSRRLQLPDGVDADDVSASFDRGVLELRIPKPVQRAPRKVAIGRPDAIDGDVATSGADSRERELATA